MHFSMGDVTVLTSDSIVQNRLSFQNSTVARNNISSLIILATGTYEKLTVK